MEVGLVQKIDIDQRDAAGISRLRHERDRGPRPAGRARRPEAGPPPHPVCHARYGHAPRYRLIKNPPASSAKCWANITRTATWRFMMPWRAWRRIFPCATCWWMGRATSAAWTATRRQRCAIPKPAWRRRPMHMLADIGKNTVDFSDNFDGTPHRADRAAGRAAQLAGQRGNRHRRGHGHQHPAPQPE